MRRMREMYAAMNQHDGMPDSYNVVVNTNHPVYTGKILKAENEAHRGQMVKHLYDLARLQQQMLKGAELTDFIQKSIDLMA
jgi:molecular chaperone HtpG